MAHTDRQPAVSFRDAKLVVGGRTLWEHLELDVLPGEFVAILGPNGTGKTSLLKALLGLLPLAGGSLTVAGREPTRGSSTVGYVPQQKIFDADLGLRGRDLVTMGVDGHRFGMPWPTRAARARVDEAIEAVGATAYANVPIGRLSGGEQQRLRIAQALISDPDVLLCDEPLTSLDLNHQEGVLDLIDRRRRASDTAILMVTHEINPILPMVDRILYLVSGNWATGTPEEVLTSERLTQLYGTPIDVLRVRGRVIVVGGGESPDKSHHCGPTEVIAS
ncbi:metal ABC transporter ATP-binding protein [Rudaeicoccus suwonensis]|uniref:Zinc/manganese transport system ATP-binding protein n=1 Tax=Rudaeicoccus suwonensis TaxID=657409 RepID=A0A561EB34_9MICO|nr:ATP-binding cassette domain-containing protein [Rudaeicoccus suwonensis]TWE12825.1 zinc/manganese transport system ATP-binding protein [Rudaeicoccus suwonensis]